jgi:hypothetical protein
MVRFAIVATLVLCFTAPVIAQDAVSVEPPAVKLQTSSVLSFAAPDRPKVLVPLYMSFGALQVVDVHSTTRALNRGAVEANPMMKAFAGNSASLIAVKAGGAAVAIYATEQLWKQNRRAAAIGLMIAANVGMTWVVQHNYRAVQ